MRVEEGRAAVDGHEVWFRRVGEPGAAPPLLLLHGGPGGGSWYLEPFEDLAADREVVFYDQLGCGRSDRPEDTSLWTLERFVREVDTVRDALGLDELHILGHSWGGWLLVEYLLQSPAGVRSAVLASTSASVPQFVAECERLKSGLPPDVAATLEKYELVGDFHNPEYEEAVMVFYLKHLYRQPGPPPDALMQTVAHLQDNPVYETMNGPNEFIVTGNLKEWDRRARLGEITTPVLVTLGGHDEMTMACARSMVDGIAGAELAVFEESAHHAQWEQREEYMRTLADFLARHDGEAAQGVS